MSEFACQFGPHGRLAGIVTEPAQGSTKTACILISAGLVPKFGPYRLYALLARRLAQLDVCTLRFDLGSIGDSGPGQGSLPLKERTDLEVKAAVDYLTSRYALDDITLCGLCSGAEDSFRYAEGDPRIRAVILIDPFCYRTSGWYWRHFLFRVTRRSLRLLGLHRPLAYAAPAVGRPALDAEALVKYQYMEHPESSRILQALVARRVRVHFVYTGGMRESFNHPDQLRKMFPEVQFRDLVTLSHLPAMEHTQMLDEDRRTMIETISRRFGVTSSRAIS